MASAHSMDLPQINEQQSPSLKEQMSPNISDDVFITPDTPISNADEKHQEVSNKEESASVPRQKIRNWADCVVDEPVTEITPPPTPELKTTSSFRKDDAADDFQVGLPCFVFKLQEHMNLGRS